MIYLHDRNVDAADSGAGSSRGQMAASQRMNWLLKRDLDPASNDNDPMWLAKVA
jgi:hypothetical protein